MSVVARTQPVKARLGRADRTWYSLWFWEIDRVLLLLAVVLISIGLVAVAAGSPAAAYRLSGGSFQMEPLFFFWRQLGWVVAGFPVLILFSMVPQKNMRRFALGAAAFFSVLLAVVPLMGVEKNGAMRWINLGIGQLQPSEFLKPFYFVTLAWVLSLRQHDRDLPVFLLTGMMTAIIGGLLMLQPDFGQTVIFVSVWLAMVTVAGLPLKRIATMIGAGVVGIVMAYIFYPVARTRINGFLFADGDTTQVDRARETITSGGLFGAGPGAGEHKFHLPEAHTDYIFSVVGEEFGIFACMAIAVLFLAITMRVFRKMIDEEDSFTILACTGLVCQLMLQALINMAVNVGIAPSKGMTLPFISYGGSSMIALCAGFGMLLAFTRRNPYLSRSPYILKWNDR
jgi:cell division protein FtsW